MVYEVYYEHFEPVVRIGEFVAVFLGRTTTGSTYAYGRVAYIEPIQPQVIDLGPLPAASPQLYPAPGNQVVLDQLKLGDYELGQWRIELLDDFLLEVRLPAAVDKWTTLNGATYASQLDAVHSNMLELYTWEHDTYIPSVRPLNVKFWQMPSARIVVYGFRYVLDEVQRRPDGSYVIVRTGQVLPATTPMTIIPVAALPPSMRGAGAAG